MICVWKNYVVRLSWLVLNSQILRFLTCCRGLGVRSVWITVTVAVLTPIAFAVRALGTAVANLWIGVLGPASTSQKVVPTPLIIACVDRVQSAFRIAHGVFVVIVIVAWPTIETTHAVVVLAAVQPNTENTQSSKTTYYFIFHHIWYFDQNWICQTDRKGCGSPEGPSQPQRPRWD